MSKRRLSREVGYSRGFQDSDPCTKVSAVYLVHIHTGLGRLDRGYTLTHDDRHTATPMLYGRLPRYCISYPFAKVEQLAPRHRSTVIKIPLRAPDHLVRSCAGTGR
eukprot:scaffold24345_cov64-Attheya_sp.AAC.7